MAPNEREQEFLDQVRLGERSTGNANVDREIIAGADYTTARRLALEQARGGDGRTDPREPDAGASGQANPPQGGVQTDKQAEAAGDDEVGPMSVTLAEEIDEAPPEDRLPEAVHAERRWANTHKRISVLERRLLARGVFPVVLAQSGGSVGDDTTATTWTYDVTDVGGESLSDTALDPVADPHVFRRPDVGPMLKATAGLAYYNSDGDLVLTWINEALDAGACE